MRTNNCKKALSLALILMLALMSLTGCGNSEGDEKGVQKEENTLTEVINIAALNGPTGMGMVQLMDQTEKYNITTYQAPTDAVSKVIAGEADLAAVPSNMAAVLYNKTEGKVVAISPITLGVLYILGNNADVKQIEDLKGKTIIASGQGGTPEYALEKILQEAGLKLYEDVEVEWLANHADVNAKLLSQEGAIAMVPEPYVSTALSAGQEGVAEIFDMNQLWEEATGEAFPLGVLGAQKSFVEDRQQDLEIFLNDYQASVDFVNKNAAEAAPLIVEKGFMGKEEIAEQAIPRCNIVLYAGDRREEGRSMLKTFNQIMYEMDPASVGGTLPDEDLYY